MKMNDPSANSRTACMPVECAPSIRRTLRLPAKEMPAQRGDIPGLDGLRAASIWLVMISHFFIPRGSGLGAFGVWIFFVLSGFLITRLVLAEKKETGFFSVRKFYLRRLLRLYPVLLTFLAVIIPLAILIDRPAPHIEAISTLFYFTNYLSAYKKYFGYGEFELPIGPLWSLSVEEHFYIIMPLAFYLFNSSIRRLLFSAVAVIFISLAIRVAYVVAFPDVIGKTIIYVLSETRFDTIATGVLLALACEMPAGRQIITLLSTRTAFLAGCILLPATSLFGDVIYDETVRFTLRNLAVAPILCAIIFGHLGYIQNVLNSRLMVWNGKISYSLYVWHGASAYILSAVSLPHEDGLVGGVCRVLVTFAFASASYYIIERPIAELRHRLRPSERPSATGFAADPERPESTHPRRSWNDSVKRIP